MDNTLNERSLRSTEAQLDQYLGTIKKVQTGVSGGCVQDSTAVGENNGTLYTNHHHGDIYIKLEAARYQYTGNELVRRPKENTKASLKLQIDKQPDSSSVEESSDDEFHDCHSSTPSPLPYKQGGQLVPLWDIIDSGHIPSSPSKHSYETVKVPNTEEVVTMMKAVSVAGAAQLGIQVRDTRQADDEADDIRLSAKGSKCIPPTDHNPGTWRLGADSATELVFTLDLRNIVCEFRLVAKYNITDTVLMADSFPCAIEKFFTFLHELYIEAMSCLYCDKSETRRVRRFSGNFDWVIVDLRNIACHIISSKTR